MEKHLSADAILLRAVSYGEGNRIFTCFGREEGKFSAVARGVRKPKSKLKGHLQLGNRCDLQLVRGRGLPTIASAQAKETYPANRENADRYFYMSYFLELLNDFVPEDQPDPTLFDLLDGALKELSVTEPALLARFFELRLLALSGYAPDFGTCALCGAPLRNGFFGPRAAGLTCGRCGGGFEVPPKALFALKYLVSAEIGLVRRLKVDEATLEFLAAVTRRLIETSLEKKVKSLDILKQLRP
ncbi:MAG: DNA repair protein RecO [Bacillota bacterium]|jgi:DNA repair protein RecO (recombination protein O)